MLKFIARKVFGSRNDRLLRKYQYLVKQINALEPTWQKLSDAELKNQTVRLKQRYQEGQTLEQLLVEAFATVREASRRVLGLRHFDVQLIGGIALHQGKVAEMRTGEGKTLVATLPAYLNALSGKGVHIITVNDYLAKRDAEWMGPVYHFLGLHVGVNLADQPHFAKKEAYAADITYGTNNEFGFDYLRDNMAFQLEDRVQRPLNFAIIDEVDSILIDEARTPLVISGPAEGSSQLYQKIDQFIPLLREASTDYPGDFIVDEKTRQVILTDHGHQKVEDILVEYQLLPAEDNLYAPQHIRLLYHINAALRAHKLFQRDVDYIVQKNEVVIVDEHTGRTMPGRRWSEGLHQAIEAKEKVAIQQENQTLATITFQNYFRLYEKLAGMTGTADTEAYELQQIYNLEVVIIPTNKAVKRVDLPDKIYLTREEKYQAILAAIKDYHAKQAPTLVGTTSIESSEYLSARLKKEGIPHQVLNAKYHAQEAEIIAQAGRPGAITIATNMAGRGTDIVLGGNLHAELASCDPNDEKQIEKIKQEWQQRHDHVLATGGLHIIGTERHESRRIDNQLRGRSGRQGDPGQTQFYLSLEDDLMRIFAGEWLKRTMLKLGMKEGEAIEHKMVSKALERAQRRVEGHNFDIRKQLLDFDDVANDQRRVIYAKRYAVMVAEEIQENIAQFREDVLAKIIEQYLPSEQLKQEWQIEAFSQAIFDQFGEKISLAAWLEESSELSGTQIHKKILFILEETYATKTAEIGLETRKALEKSVLLQVIDHHWRDHLATMDQLRQGIHWRGYAQKNPKQEYKQEAYMLFAQMLEAIKAESLQILSIVRIQTPEEAAALQAEQAEILAAIDREHQQASQIHIKNTSADNEPAKNNNRPEQKISRNAACPCGSGKKYKHCHGQLS